MLTPNGGVFGRNPKFNNVTVSGTLTSAGNVTLGTGANIVMASGNGISFAATSDPSILATKATGAITRTATNVANNDTVTIGTTVYTFKTALTPANYEVLIAGSAADSLTNLRHAILGTGGTPGTDYQVPAAHPTVTALAISGSTLPLEAITAGTAGNSIALAETSAQLGVSAATLLGGSAAGGMTSELLADYETGTWTPRYVSSGGTLIVTHDIVEGRYTKIGNQVTLNMRLSARFVDASGASGVLRIAGLPYNAAAASFGGSGIFSLGFASNANPNVVNLSSTVMELNKSSGSDARSGTTSSSPADLATGPGSFLNYVIISATYLTA